MPQKGMLVQIDASPHEWIIGEGSFSLHGAIDDATGEILALFFTPNECMEGYFEIIRQIIARYGIPMSIYCDRHTIFVSLMTASYLLRSSLRERRLMLPSLEEQWMSLELILLRLIRLKLKVV